MRKAKLTLRPGQRGTKKWMALYGDRLLCVRYRYDLERKVRVTTVELIVEETAWMPDPARRAWNAIVEVRIAAEERTLQRTVKAAGGKWNPEKKVWEMLHQKVIELGLQDRVCG